MTSEDRKADPPFDDPDADVIIQSSDKVNFYVFKSLLSYSSSVFKDMFCIAQGQPGDEEMKDGLQVILTDDSAETWSLLFRFLYPLWAAGPPRLKSLDECSRVMASSGKYGIVGMKKIIASELIARRFLETEPMRVYAMACQYGLDAEARVAAKQTLHLPILGHPYFSEMEQITAGDYRRLHEYHQQCGKAASEVARNTTWIEKPTFVWFSKHKCAAKERASVTTNSSYGSVVTTQWWYDYMQSAAQGLEDRPVGSTVLGSSLVDDALRYASQCYFCSAQAFAEMREFGQIFAAQVDKAVAKIVLRTNSNDRSSFS